MYQMILEEVAQRNHKDSELVSAWNSYEFVSVRWKHIQSIAFTFSFSPYHASVTKSIFCQIPTIFLPVVPTRYSQLLPWFC